MAETVFAPMFDEEWYLTQYPDVADAVQKGRMGSARAHFLVHGRPEGRRGYRFDSKWYVETYPPVNRDINQARAVDPQEHFERYGRFRGYLPHAEATRPEIVTNQQWHDGGLWIDLPNADDLIAGKEEAGLIDSTHAALLSDFRVNGFVVLRAAIPSHVIDDARYDLARAYLGCLDTLMFDSDTNPAGPTRWGPATNDAFAAALDIHWVSPAIRTLIFRNEIVSFMQLLFDSRPIAYSSRCCLRGLREPYGQDAMRWPTTRLRHSAGVWFALETVGPSASNPVCWSGSHRIQNPSNDDRHIGMTDEGTGLYPSMGVAGSSGSECLDRLGGSNTQEKVLLLDKGDAVIWHAGLWHGEQAVAQSRIMRRSIEVQYCPINVAPTFWESRPAPLMEYGDQGFYTADSR